jgi:hypothetical protein
MKLTTDLHLVLRLRMLGAIPLLLHISSWCGVSLRSGYILMAQCLVKHKDFTFTIIIPSIHSKIVARLV